MGLKNIAIAVSMPIGSAPESARIIFTLSGWDFDVDTIYTEGPIEVVLGGDGLASVNLETTTDKERQMVYAVTQQYYSRVLRRTITESLGVIPVPHMGGPFTLTELLTVPIEAVTSETALAQIQGLKVAIDLLAQAAVEAAAASAQNLSDVLDFTETQMRTVSEFSSMAAFIAYIDAFDYFRMGSVVNIGDVTLQKRATSGGLAWVEVSSPAHKLMNGYLEDRSGAIFLRHLADIPADTVLANVFPTSRNAPPRAVPIEEFLASKGMRWIGSTASGGMSFPVSAVTPNAPTGMRTGRGSSLAGATAVTFATPFAPCRPHVDITVTALDGADADGLSVAIIGTSTETGFSFVIRKGGASVIREFSYHAIGQDDI